MIRIIIVEDDPLVAQLNAAYLSRMEGVQVAAFSATAGTRWNI